MVYMGSKARLKKFIVPVISSYLIKYNIKTYIEPFVGGANLIDSVICRDRRGSDINPYLIALLNYIKTDPKLTIAPADCSKEHYDEVRNCFNNHADTFTTEYVALIGYAASYAGRFFDGGYGRDSKEGRIIYKERLANMKKQAPRLKNIEFTCRDYRTYNSDLYQNCVFYCDPPYINTKGYAVESFDHAEYYDWCRELAKKNIVICSEYTMPDDFKCIGQSEQAVLQKSDRISGDIAVEKLFLKSDII